MLGSVCYLNPASAFVVHFSLPLATPRTRSRSTIPRCATQLNKSIPSPLLPQSASQVARDLISRRALHPKDAYLLEMFSPSRAALFAKVLLNRTRHLTVVLDGVHGAHNLAAVARSCDACGVQDVHMISQPDAYLPKRRKGSADNVVPVSILERFKTEQSVQSVSKNCHKWLTIREHDRAEDCLRMLRRDKYKVLVSSLCDSAVSIHDVDVSEKCAFVFGNEKHGVSDEMIAHADGVFTIPMMGFVESMNVSVAVATTLALMTSKCRQTMSKVDYLLAQEEQSQLAHMWLTDRFRYKGPPKYLITRRDVTKLGHQCESRVIKEGMFATAETSSPDYWGIALRPTGEGGRRVITEFARRKVSVLGEIGFGFDKRAVTIKSVVAGSHALSCEASLSASAPSKITRATLCKYFESVCDLVSDMYRPHFDQFGVPVLPGHVEESLQVFRDLEMQAPVAAQQICQKFAVEVLGLREHEAARIVLQAGLIDIADCIADTVRCCLERDHELRQIAVRPKDFDGDLRSLLAKRDAAYQFRPVLACGNWPSDQSHLSNDDRAALQVFLRISNAAFLCSELYQCIWERHTMHNASRIHSMRFALLEALLSDAYAEMSLLQTPHEPALFRLIFEWGQVLARLQEWAASEG